MNLGVEGVDFYGGTRHSTVTVLRDYFSPERIRKDGTLHRTNKAFDRYLQSNSKDAKEIYTTALKLTLLKNIGGNE